MKKKNSNNFILQKTFRDTLWCMALALYIITTTCDRNGEVFFRYAMTIVFTGHCVQLVCSIELGHFGRLQSYTVSETKCTYPYLHSMTHGCNYQLFSLLFAVDFFF